MKRVVCILIVIFFLTLNILPSSTVFADDGFTNNQLANIGALMLSGLITSGEATEIDFSDYTGSDGLDWLISFGELAVTGDVSGLVEKGLDWLGGELSDTYDDLIWSIREWEYSIAPDLYNWWYNGSDYEINLEKVENVANPLRKLLTPPDNAPQPEPDPNYSFVNIIGTHNVGNSTNFYNIDVMPNFLNNSQVSKSTYDYCLVLPTNSNQQISTYINSGTYSFPFFTTVFDILLTTQSGTESVLVSYRNLNYQSVINGYSGFYSMGTNSQHINWIWASGNNNYNQITNTNFPTSFIGVGTAINFFYNHYRGCNLYVDGHLWVSASEVTYPINVGDQFTVLNSEPVQYYFSEPTYLDLSGLTTLITNAINSSDILTWQDIDDYFLDVNGVQALPTVSIIRNDYDNMYIEQYPYPATLIGFNDPLKFNEHMLDNVSGQYLTPMVNVTKNTVNVLPNEIKWVLGIGAILSIFALIINRLLE